MVVTHSRPPLDRLACSSANKKALWMLCGGTPSRAVTSAEGLRAMHYLLVLCCSSISAPTAPYVGSPPRAYTSMLTPVPVDL